MELHERDLEPKLKGVDSFANGVRAGKFEKVVRLAQMCEFGETNI